MQKGITVLSLFDGMSCGQLALREAGIPVKRYFSSEIDKHAMKLARANFPDTVFLGDVTKVSALDLPRIDLCLAGSPCQGFSKAGKGLNFEDPRINLGKAGCLTPYNNSSRACLDSGTTFICVAMRGRPQNGKNIQQFEAGAIPGKTNCLTSVQKDNLIFQRGRGKNEGGEKAKNGKTPTLSGEAWRNNNHLIEGGSLRRLTPFECAALQGVPRDYFFKDGQMIVSESQIYKVCGLGWTIPVISHILSFAKFTQADQDT